VRERIRGYTDAVLEESSPGGVVELAGDLASVRDLVAGSADLRLVLTDSGVPTHARRGVINDLLATRVSANAIRLLVYVIEADRAAEVADDLDWLATRVAASRDGLVEYGSGVLGHHSALERVEGYATAVLEPLQDQGLVARVASQLGHRTLGDVEDDLFRFQRIVAGSTDLSDALTNRDLPPSVRRSLVEDLLGSKAAPVTVRLAGYAATVGRARDYLALLDALVERVAAETQRRIASVRAPVELTDAQQQRLADALSRLVGQRVEVRVIVDPSVLGGFVANIGDTVVDASARHRLDLLKERLAFTRSGDARLGDEAASTS
jgi:F-type H+-transporting ATPase subunit delta